MTDAEARALWAEGRGNPLTPEQSRRAALAEKTNQLLSMPRNANGAVGSMQAAADAVNARMGNPQPATPQPAPEPVQQGFSPNRPQGASIDSPPAISEKQVNAQKIAAIRAERGL